MRSTVVNGKFWASLAMMASCGHLAAQTLDTVISGGLAEPYGIAVDAVNSYYITDSVNNRVIRYSPATGVITNFVGLAGSRGNTDDTGQFARFFSPQGIVAARGGFVVADSGNHLIRRIGLDGRVETIAGGRDQTGDFRDDVGLAARFNSPSGIATDGSDNIYIADMGNSLVRKIDGANVVTSPGRPFFDANPSMRLNRPSAVAVGDDGRIYVADTGNHSIKAIEPNGNVTLVAGSNSRFVSGFADSVVATDALFDSPRGLLWVGGKTGLIVSDTRNHVLRRIFADPNFGNVISVQTMQNTFGAGLLSPVGAARDLDGNILIVDLEAGMLRRIQSSQTVQPPVRRPVIGVVNLVTNLFNELVTQLTPVTNAVFNNDAVIAITSEQGTQTYFTLGATANLDSIPDPDPQSGTSPPQFIEGSSTLPQSIINPPQPDVVIKAIGTAPERVPSSMVTARFRFQVANPVIVGNNPGAVVVETPTTGGELWYTVDGSIPARGGSSLLYSPGSKLNVVSGTNNVVFNVRGFKDGYLPSSVAQRTFFFTNLLTSTIGVTRDLFAGVGSTVVVPVEVKLAPGDDLNALQLRVELKPGTASTPELDESVRALPIDADNFVAIKSIGAAAPDTMLQELESRNRVLGLYYNSGRVRLTSGAATVALLGIKIPPAAEVGHTYSISVSHASGTALDSRDIRLTNLPPTLIIVTNIAYTVGDTATATWYGAGEFGNTELRNNDVNNVFFASLGIRVPFAFTDAYDAMDAFPRDTVEEVGGDGRVRFLDWQRVLRLALGLDTDNWKRIRMSDGLRVASRTSLGGGFDHVAQATTLLPGAVWVRQGRITTDTVQRLTPAGSVTVPIRLSLAPGHTVSGLQFRAAVVPNGFSPALTEAVRFTPSVASSSLIMVSGLPPNEIGCGWNLGSFDPALANTVVIGTLEFRVPSTARDRDSYAIKLSYADGAPNASTQYDFETMPGTAWVGTEAPQSTDVITPEWREHFFGSAENPDASNQADPDGDGASNTAEYLAGTNPRDAGSKLELQPAIEGTGTQRRLVLRWMSAPGKRYLIEQSSSLSAGSWQVLASDVAGDGTSKRLDAPPVISNSQFYRVKIQP